MASAGLRSCRLPFIITANHDEPQTSDPDGSTSEKVFSSVFVVSYCGPVSRSAYDPAVEALCLLVLSVGGCCWFNANILTRTELLTRNHCSGESVTLPQAKARLAARGRAHELAPLCEPLVYMTETQADSAGHCTRTAPAPVSCVLTGRFFHTHSRRSRRARAGRVPRPLELRPRPGALGGTAPRTHAALAGRWAAKTARAAARAASATTTAGAMAGR